MDVLEVIRDLSIILFMMIGIFVMILFIVFGVIIYRKLSEAVNSVRSTLKSTEETAKVGDLIHNLKKQNITIILISHDIHDVFDYSDRVAVLKNGALVGKRLIKEVSKDDVLKMIISGD